MITDADADTNDNADVNADADAGADANADSNMDVNVIPNDDRANYCKISACDTLMALSHFIKH